MILLTFHRLSPDPLNKKCMENNFPISAQFCCQTVKLYEYLYKKIILKVTSSLVTDVITWNSTSLIIQQ
jgi:hypothetical protein